MQECCDKHHKHYVVNTESMAGVCVRHNDDCDAVCVPAQQDPTKRRVCTKASTQIQTTLPSCTAWQGCNRLVKVPNMNAANNETDEAKLFDIAVCQACSHILLRETMIDSPF